MRWDDIDKQVCSVARAVSIVGERWTMLIIRDAFLGTRRFDQFQSNLGVTRHRLSERLGKLVDQFNPGAVSGLMCRNTVSISWDGRLYDCDFNQMLDLPLILDDGTTPTIGTVDPTALGLRSVVTSPHCFGCTAGGGSSCTGALGYANPKK